MFPGEVLSKHYFVKVTFHRREKETTALLTFLTPGSICRNALPATKAYLHGGFITAATRCEVCLDWQ